MLIERYAPVDVFAPVPELAKQTDPELKALDALLDDDRLFEQVKADLARRFAHTTDRGRHSTPVEAILRLLLVKHLHNWSFQQTEEGVADSLVLRWFTRVYFRRVPDDTTLIRWSRLMRPETLEALNERVVQLAVRAQVTSGRKLRVDATCVPTNIHHPTDSGLLVDSVRVLSRIVQRAKPVLAQTRGDVAELCRSRLQSARRIAQSLHRLLRRKGEEKLSEQRELSQHLVEITEEVVQQAERVAAALRRRGEKRAQQLRDQVQHFLPHIRRVIAQTRTRVLEGQKVASEEKVLSLFEPHTRGIPRHKGGADVEFGRLVMLYAGGGRPRDPFPDPGAASRTWAGRRGARAPSTPLRTPATRAGRRSRRTLPDDTTHLGGGRSQDRCHSCCWQGLSQTICSRTLKNVPPSLSLACGHRRTHPQLTTGLWVAPLRLSWHGWAQTLARLGHPGLELQAYSPGESGSLPPQASCLSINKPR
jgi:hypothetical protein